jgi:hypothetical protein
LIRRKKKKKKKRKRKGHTYYRIQAIIATLKIACADKTRNLIEITINDKNDENNWEKGSCFSK